MNGENRRLSTARLVLPSERYAELEKLRLEAKSTTEFEVALDKFKNGKVVLEPMGR